MAKQKYIISNLVYGDTYSKMFLNNHLTSVLDPTNLPAIAKKYDIEHLIFTDEATATSIAKHPNAVALSHHCKVNFKLFQWPKGVTKFEARYTRLINMFHESVDRALKDDALLTCWVADFVLAKDFFPRIMAKMDAGHDAVFMMPIRSCMEGESMEQALRQAVGALPDNLLFQLAYENMHPLWTHSHWDNPQFTKQPFSLVWNSETAILVRTYATTPLVFKVRPEMMDGRGMIDGDVPKHCTNPFWSNNWTDAPVAEVSPIQCYAPTFTNRPANTTEVAKWSKELDPIQWPMLEHKCYYPDIDTFIKGPHADDVLEKSNLIVSKIQKEASRGG